ncbi:FAD-dependent monooxygenase [Salmonirosea aquatica]|uniref:NAD(P)-binding protein n=1 Tax=Salmonirosea aquatica TaxID=2654236 RepID=A0A7C9FQD7_9BACT|nr:NAD(P)-binding protein [Cytophagaceae bacterium SJW1-29]
MKNNPSFTIIGGGIAGLTAAIALSRIGLSTHVFEASPRLRPLGAGLALAANAMQAFKRLGIADNVIQKGRQIDTFSILDEGGKTVSRTDSRAVSERYGIDNFAIHRAELHEVLLNQLPTSQVSICKKAIRIEELPGGVTVFFDDGTTHRSDYLLVADGIHSPIRQQLVPGSVPRYAGYSCWRAVVYRPDLALTEATETWGRRGRVGIVPLTENRVYWFACVNAPAQSPLMRRMTSARLAELFGEYHAPIPGLLSQTPDENLLWNDIIDLKPLSSFAFGRTLLLGDAAHATTPNMGQGACQAIEDAVVLADTLAKNDSVEEAFREFEKRRLTRTRTITNNSRRIGQVAQWSNPLLATMRNYLFRHMPASANERQLEMLYSVDF